MNYAELRKNLKEQVQNALEYTREYEDWEIEDLIDDSLMNLEGIQTLDIPSRRKLRKEVFDSLRRLDLLQSFIDDPTVTEIMINGKDNIFVEQKGYLRKLPERFESEEKLVDVIQQIVAGCNRVVNEASPIVDARLPDGSRVNVVMRPVSLCGPTLTIRRFPEKAITMEELIRLGSISREAAEFLGTLVQAKYNVFICGGTGSGKTTFLNVLSGCIPSDERLITIEDSAELQIQGIDNLVRLETRNSNADGCREIAIRDLIRSALRMRPDRIVVGEVRGPETMDLLTALNSGHDGSMSTGHANSAADMLSRLENMILMAADLPLTAIRQQLASGLDIIVHLGRLRDKSRRVLEIVEVMGYENGEIKLAPLYRFEETGVSDGKVLGELRKTGELDHREKLRAAGLQGNLLG